MFAVTTRNKLRSRRFVPNMILAWLNVRNQLYQTSGILRYITGIATLTEFYTLTLWENQEAMFRFVSSGSHRRLMWMFSRWSSSFWSMRWVPADEELGAWNGLQITCSEAKVTRQAAAFHNGRETRLKLAEALGSYIDAEGRPGLRNPDPSASGISAVVLRAPSRSPTALRRLRRAVHSRRAAQAPLRCIHGIGPGESLVLALWQRERTAEARSFMQDLSKQTSESWSLLLRAGDYEVGHWDGLRLRQFTGAHQREESGGVPGPPAQV